MIGFWNWLARLVCITMAVLSLRVILVERANSLDTKMPRAPELPASNAPKLGASAPSKPNQASEVSAGTSAVLGVKHRLVELLDSAEIVAPSLEDPRIRNLLRAHWRKVHSPLVGPSGSVGRLVQQIGLSSVVATKEPESAASDGHWHADPKVWGLDEGTYDQRESILAAAPSRLTFKLNLLAHSVIETAPAAFDGDGEVVFEVAVTQAGVRRVLGEKKVSKSRRFNDWRIELSGISGEVELELKTSSAHESPLAAWGSPVILSPSASRLPYNTVFIVVDAMRSDAIASAHDAKEDAAMSASAMAPLDAWLPRMPEVAPNLDKLVSRGAIFAKAWTAAMWTRPATLAMLSGMRPHRLGMPVLELEPRPEHVRAFYDARPPLFALLMRAEGAVTRAVINNMYLCGYVGVGVDTGFEAMTDHRYQTQDTARITADTIDWLKAHRDERFALFINYTSPHAPYMPEREYLEPVDGAPVKPGNRQVRRYLAEIRKDDEGIGRVLDELQDLGLSDKTAVVVTADHGETMSEAHDWVAVDVAKGVPSGRFTHLSTMWDEAARVPIIMSLPGRIAANRRFTDEVQSTDILPTLLDLQGQRIPSEIDGVSLLPLLDGKTMAARPVVIEGRGAQSIRDGDWRLVVRSPVARRIRKGDVEFEKAIELYNVSDDPGERRDVSATNKDVVARLKTELERLMASKKSASVGQKPAASSGTVSLRFATAGRVARVHGAINLKGEGTLKIVPEGGSGSVHVMAKAQNGYDVAFQSSAVHPIGLKLLIEPADAELEWKWWLDDVPWPKHATFGGPLGVWIAALEQGLSGAVNDELVVAEQPYISAKRDLGLFATRELRLDSSSTLTESAQMEAQQAMQAWGYVRKPEVVKRVRAGAAP